MVWFCADDNERICYFDELISCTKEIDIITNELPVMIAHKVEGYYETIGDLCHDLRIDARDRFEEYELKHIRAQLRLIRDYLIFDLNDSENENDNDSENENENDNDNANDS